MLNKIAKVFIYFYKYIISPILPNSCRYIPSCSTYAVEAFQKHTFFYASFLVVKRILSCHPFSKKPMLDEVPEKLKSD